MYIRAATGEGTGSCTDTAASIDSPWQLRHLHKAKHIHVCCWLQSRLQIYHLLHSASMLSQSFTATNKQFCKKWSFHKSGGEISPVVGASAWLSDRCVLASAAQIHSPWKRIWQGSLPWIHPSKHACVRCVKPPSFNFHRGGMMCGSRAVTTALEGGRESRGQRQRGRDRGGGSGVRWEWRRGMWEDVVWAHGSRGHKNNC